MQTTIYNEHDLGINGVIAKAETQYLATIQGILVADTAVGKPVGFGENEGEFVNASLTADNFAGFVVRDGFISDNNIPTETYKAGKTATIITKGSLYIKSPIALTQGEAVKIGADGVIARGGAITTGWRVETGCEADGIAIITTQFK